MNNALKFHRLLRIIQERWSIFLNEEPGTSGKLLLGVSVGFKGGVTLNFYKCALRLQENPFL